MKSLLIQLWFDETGQDLTEYALLMALIALGAIAATQGLATTLDGMFQNAASNIAAAGR
jgi:Flp pilus assembly pilin Flp